MEKKTPAVFKQDQNLHNQNFKQIKMEEWDNLRKLDCQQSDKR